VLRRLEALIDRIASVRVLIVCSILLAAALVSVQLFDLPWSLPRLKKISGGTGILDMRFHYSALEGYRTLNALGADGRRFYLVRVLGGIDILLPLLMAFFLSVAITLVMRRSYRRRPGLHWLKLVPFAATLIDYLENTVIAVLLFTYPERHLSLAAAAGWITSTKFVVYWGSCLIVIGWVFFNLLTARRRINSRKNRKSEANSQKVTIFPGQNRSDDTQTR
jgi:hypothetical protein